MTWLAGKAYLYTNLLFLSESRAWELSWEPALSVCYYILGARTAMKLSAPLRFPEIYIADSLDRERTWRIIGSMKSLQFLWVRIAWPKQEITAREERRLMEPLCQVGELNCFEVSLPPVIGQEPPKGKEEHWVVLRRKR
jgi:hypothetical protein